MLHKLKIELIVYLKNNNQSYCLLFHFIYSGRLTLIPLAYYVFPTSRLLAILY